MRLILHTGAYWLLLDLRAAVPSWYPLRQTEFATIRLRLLKIAGRIIETASRVRIALASCCPEAETFSLSRAQAATVWAMSVRGGDAPRAIIHPTPTRLQRPRPNQTAEAGASQDKRARLAKIVFRSCARLHKAG